MVSIPQGQPKWNLAGNIRGRDAAAPDTKAIVAEVLGNAELQLTADRVELRELIKSEVARAIAAMPEPKNGKDGNGGRDGRDGRDASEIEIVENVVEGRHYAKGTLGIIKGGLYRSRGDSWEILIPPPPSVVDIITEKVGRTTTHRYIWSDGKETPRTITSDEMLYREVWTDREYERGDVVTHDGSLWHCQAGKTHARPGGTTRDWKLCRKRDGKASADGGEKEVLLQELLARIAVLEAALKDGIPSKDTVPNQANPTALIRIEQPTTPRAARTKKVGTVIRQPDGAMRFELQEQEVLEATDGA